MTKEDTTIDVWMQHPTLRFISHPMFDSLKRWMKGKIPDEEIPVELTLELMDHRGLSSQMKRLLR